MKYIYNKTRTIGARNGEMYRERRPLHEKTYPDRFRVAGGNVTENNR